MRVRAQRPVCVVSREGGRKGKGPGSEEGGRGGKEGGNHTLLPPTELLDPLLVVVLAVKRDADPHTRIILHALASLRIRVVLISDLSIRLALYNQPSSPRRNQFLKHACEFPRDLLERALDGFVFALIKHGDQLLDRRLRGIEFFPSLRERVPLVGELVVLLKSLFIHVAVFLEGFVDFMQPLDDGVAFRLFELGEGFLREDAEVADAAADFGGLFGQEGFLLDALFHALLLALDAFGDVFLLAAGFGVAVLELGDLGGGAIDGGFDFEEFLGEAVHGFVDAFEVFLGVAKVALSAAVGSIEGLGA